MEHFLIFYSSAILFKKKYQREEQTVEKVERLDIFCSCTFACLLVFSWALIHSSWKFGLHMKMLSPPHLDCESSCYSQNLMLNLLQICAFELEFARALDAEAEANGDSDSTWFPSLVYIFVCVICVRQHASILFGFHLRVLGSFFCLVHKKWYWHLNKTNANCKY